MSFAIGELKCPSLDYIYRMTWAEFQIRLHAFKRQDEYEWVKIRDLAYTSLIAFYQDPKKIPKTKQKFMPLPSDKKTKGISQEMIKAIENAKQKYREEVENGKSKHTS